MVSCYLRRWTWTGDFKCREVKTGFYRNRWMQTGSSGTLIGWKSGQTTFVPLWDWMEGSWLRTLVERGWQRGQFQRRGHKNDLLDIYSFYVSLGHCRGVDSTPLFGLVSVRKWAGCLCKYYLCTQLLYCPLGQQVISLLHRIHRVAMTLLSGEHSIMMVKWAQAG